jgi:protein TonB
MQIANFPAANMAHPAPPRFLGIGFAGLLTASFIIALAAGLGYKVELKPLTQTDVIFVPPKPPVTEIPPTPGTITLGKVVIPKPWVDFSLDDSSGNSIDATSNTNGIMPAAGISSTHTTPDYPVQSRALGEKGVVLLAITVDELGRVSAAQVTRSSGFPRLDAAAVSWVTAHWRYRPAMQNGKPIVVKTQATVTFKLH